MGGDNHGQYHTPKPMVRRHGASSLNEYMIHPSSTVRKAWDVLVCTLLLYCALALPLYIAFGVEEHDLLRLLDRTVDCVFMLDVLLNFAHVSTSAPEPYVRPTLVKPEDAQQRIVLKVSHPGLSQAPTPSLQPQPQPRPRPNPNRAAAIRASNA